MNKVNDLKTEVAIKALQALIIAKDKGNILDSEEEKSYQCEKAINYANELVKKLIIQGWIN